MIFRCILPDYVLSEDSSLRKVREGEYTEEELLELNGIGYNIYKLPNYPQHYKQGITVDGSHIDTFEYAFLDMDLKDNIYPSKEAFVEKLLEFPLMPTSIVDSGNGIHAYWRITDLDAMSYLRLQRRLCRFFKTDEAVSKIYQLMRHTGTVNTKRPDALSLCQELHYEPVMYTCEELDTALPKITLSDEEYCKNHYDKTYSINQDIKVDDVIPDKFKRLLRNNKEVKDIWANGVDDRSKGDYRLGHIMWGNDFTRSEAMSVLVNSAKALSRSPTHRINYALNIVEKIWTFEETGNTDELSSSVRDILSKAGDTIKGTRFPCHRYLDATEKGFRLGQVIGLVAGSGVGKTAMALNMFEGFVQNNPDYDHFFVPLEQPAHEIAERWKTMCGDNTSLHDKVHVISNYDKDGNFRHLSLNDIQDYLVSFQQKSKRKVGCVVIDHIGALKKQGRNGENQDLMDICHAMKAFAIKTNTMLVMQSQAPREKAGIGDLELNKDAAYGTVYFESYCDYLITIWQPLKRTYTEGAPTVTAFKFCKIRHKRQGVDEIQEDVPYTLMFDPTTERMRTLDSKEEVSFNYFNPRATNLRGKDRKTDVVAYKSISWNTEAAIVSKTSSDTQSGAA